MHEKQQTQFEMPDTCMVLIYDALCSEWYRSHMTMITTTPCPNTKDSAVFDSHPIGNTRLQFVANKSLFCTYAKSALLTQLRLAGRPKVLLLFRLYTAIHLSVITVQLWSFRGAVVSPGYASTDCVFHIQTNFWTAKLLRSLKRAIENCKTKTGSQSIPVRCQAL